MPRLPIALAGLILAATPSIADVTPREVWDGWLASLAESDAEVSTGSVDETGGRLVVKGLSIVAETEEERRYSVDVDEVALEQNSDGSVGVTVSPEYPIVLNGIDADGVPHETQLLVRHPDLEMTVADDDGVRRHLFSAPEIDVMIQQILESGEPLDAAGTLVLKETDGRYDVGDADERESTFAASSIAFDMSGTDPDTGDKYKAALGMQGFRSANILQFVGPDTAALARRLPEDTSIDGSFSTDSTTFRFENDGADSGAFSGTMGPGETRLTLSAEGVGYTTKSQETSLAFSGSSIPMPELTLDFGETTLGLTVPVLAGEEPQPFEVQVSMLDVALDEGLWNMLDPAGILPRDPGAIVLHVTGALDVKQDLDTTNVAEDAANEIRSLKLETARVAFVDAQADAGGDLTMHYSPDGTPLPVGQIDVTIGGASHLLERLVQAGIVPQQQAMATQMMLNMFAKPGANEGELVSTIRFTEDGQTFVNDQQVQ